MTVDGRDRSRVATSHGRRQTLVLTALALAALVWRWWGLWPWNLADLAVYIEGGGAILAGGDLYRDIPGELPFTYPPLAALAFVPLALMGTPAAAVVMTTLTAVGTTVVGWLVLGRSRCAWLPALTLGSLALEPFVRTLVLGQLNVILMLLVVVDLLVLPPRWRGLLIGLAAAVKLTPALFVAVLLLRRDWFGALRSGGGFVVPTGLAWLALPQLSASYWSANVASLQRFGPEFFTPANQSLRASLSRWMGQPEVPRMVAVLALAFAATLAITAILRLGHNDPVGQLAAGGLGMHLLSPVSWTHHWVWVLVALAWFVRRRWWAAAWLTAALFYVAPQWAIGTDHDASLRLAPIENVIASGYLIWAIAVLVSMVLVRRGRRDEASVPPIGGHA